MVTLPSLWTVSCSCTAFRWPSAGSASGLVRPLIACAISSGHIPSEHAATELVGNGGRQQASTEENPARGPGVRVGVALRKQQRWRRATGWATAGAQHTGHRDSALAGRGKLVWAVGAAPLFLNACGGATCPPDAQDEIRPARRRAPAILVVVRAECGESAAACSSPE